MLNLLKLPGRHLEAASIPVLISQRDHYLADAFPGPLGFSLETGYCKPWTASRTRATRRKSHDGQGARPDHPRGVPVARRRDDWV